MVPTPLHLLAESSCRVSEESYEPVGHSGRRSGAMTAIESGPAALIFGIRGRKV
jgi:hypothetical protein